MAIETRPERLGVGACDHNGKERSLGRGGLGVVGLASRVRGAGDRRMGLEVELSSLRWGGPEQHSLLARLRGWDLGIWEPR